MSSEDAAEQRRLKILRNSERRLELLLGFKKAEEITDTNNVVNIETPTNTNLKENINSESSVHQRRHSKPTLAVAETNTESSTVNETRRPSVTSTNMCQFSGYSNLELIVLTSLAFITSLLFVLGKSDLIFQNALLPFATFQLAHIIMHHKTLPSSSSSHLISYINLLKLFGIRQTSIKNLITTANFMFILIDNFVIYLFSFIISCMLIHAVNIVFF